MLKAVDKPPEDNINKDKIPCLFHKNPFQIFCSKFLASITVAY